MQYAEQKWIFWVCSHADTSVQERCTGSCLARNETVIQQVICVDGNQGVLAIVIDIVVEAIDDKCFLVTEFDTTFASYFSNRFGLNQRNPLNSEMQPLL
jgi:hypothetical protein